MAPQGCRQLEYYRRLLAAEIRRRLSADDLRPGTGLIARRRIEDLEMLAATPDVGGRRLHKVRTVREALLPPASVRAHPEVDHRDERGDTRSRRGRRVPSSVT